MSEVLQVTADDELPIFFEAGGEWVFGLLTAPVRNQRGIGIVTAPGGWFGTSSGRNRLLIRLSRELAADAFHTFRFDYHGVGESSGTVETFRLDRLFTEELEGAVRTVREHGLERFILVGVCMGARVALSVGRDLDGLEALVLVSPPVHDGQRPARMRAASASPRGLVRRVRPWMIGDLLRPERRALYKKQLRKRWRRFQVRLGRAGRAREDELAWVSASLLGTLEAMVDRQVPVLIVYGTEDANYLEFLAARRGRLGDLLRRAGSKVEVEMIEGPVHGFGQIRVQDAVIGSIRRWTRRIADASTADPTSRRARSIEASE